MKRNSKKAGRKQKIRLILFFGILLAGAVIAGRALHPSIIQQEVKTNTAQDAPTLFTERHTKGKKTGLAPIESTTTPETTIINPSGWNLLLVNPWNRIPDDFSAELTQLKNGHAIDKRAYPDLQAMMDTMRAEGLSPLICSSYRTNEKQQTLYNNKVNQYLAQGYSQAEAEAEAGKWVAVPGTSEHQTGLAVDIVALSYQLLDENQENTAEQKWLMENSYKYGFILRYPSEKSEITGINYEPWHYRYVGRDAAKAIYEQGICLEEYLEHSH